MPENIVDLFARSKVTSLVREKLIGFDTLTVSSSSRDFESCCRQLHSYYYHIAHSESDVLRPKQLPRTLPPFVRKQFIDSWMKQLFFFFLQLDNDIFVNRVNGYTQAFFCAFEEKVNGPKSYQNSIFDQNSKKKTPKTQLTGNPRPITLLLM